MSRALRFWPPVNGVTLQRTPGPIAVPVIETALAMVFSMVIWFYSCCRQGLPAGDVKDISAAYAIDSTAWLLRLLIVIP